MYYYILEEYRVSNTLLTEDIYVRLRLLLFLGGVWLTMHLLQQALQASVQRIEAYTRGFEERVAKIERK